MGTTISFTTGLITTLILISLFAKNWIVIIRYFVKAVIAIFLFAAIFTLILSQNDDYKAHFEKIITGRAEKSSGGRFGLWGRGIDVFEKHNVLLWGVGPENFREVDAAQSDNQLHNDILAFTVERGLIGISGLLLFAFVTIGRAAYLLMMHIKYPEQVGLIVVVFPGIVAAIMLVSLTHQVFHARELWLLLALQESTVFRVRESILSSYVKLIQG